MTGSGTQDDPFLVDNWADFRTIDTNSAGVYVKWADAGNKVIDFNDVHPEGFSTTVSFPANVDFNGWTLKNFHSTAQYAFRSYHDCIINNLILENLYITSRYLFNGIILFKNCIISGIVQYDNLSVFTGCGLQNCSLNLRVNASSLTFMTYKGFSYSFAQITNSDIILNILCNGTYTEICDASIKNSRISGKIQTSAQRITLGNSSSMSNVFNLESNAPLYCQGTGISLYNADFAEKSSDSNQNFIGVTSEQLKNAEYLYNLGFPIGAE